MRIEVKLMKCVVLKIVNKCTSIHGSFFQEHELEIQV